MSKHARNMYLYPNFKRVNKNVNISPLHWTKIAVNIDAHKDQIAVIKFQFSLFLFKVHFFWQYYWGVDRLYFACSNTLKISMTSICLTFRCYHLKDKRHSRKVRASSQTLFPFIIISRSDSIINYLSKIFCFYIQI